MLLSTSPANSQGSASAKCVVVINGGGTPSGFQEQDETWRKIDVPVFEAAADKLEADGYDVRRLPGAEQDKDADALAVRLFEFIQRVRCEKVLQISRSFKIDKSNPNAISGFSYDAMVFHFGAPELTADRKAQAITPIADHRRSFEYPLTSKIMKELSLEGVGEQIAVDAEKSKTLPKP